MEDLFDAKKEDPDQLFQACVHHAEREITFGDPATGEKAKRVVSWRFDWRDLGQETRTVVDVHAPRAVYRFAEIGHAYLVFELVTSDKKDLTRIVFWPSWERASFVDNGKRTDWQVAKHKPPGEGSRGLSIHLRSPSGLSFLVMEQSPDAESE